MIGSFEVIYSIDMIDIGILAISFFGNSDLERLCKIIERVTHLSDANRLVIPFLHLGWIGFHLLVESRIYILILFLRILCGFHETIIHDAEAIKHLAGDIHRQHCHQDNVHQVDHLLAWGNCSFLYCHFFLLRNRE